MGNSASTANVAGDARPPAPQTNTAGTAANTNMGNVSSPVGGVNPQQQQQLTNMTPLDVVHSLARNEMKNATPTRPARLGDATAIVDEVKQAGAMKRVQDAQKPAPTQREPASVREGKYSIYNSPVACNRMPNVFPLDDCLRASQHQFFEARQALRYQRHMCLPCNECYGDYNNGGGNVAKAFADDNNVRGARTNDALLSRDHRTIMANLQARQRLVQCNARPSQLEHSEQTTKMSPAAAAIEALASQTTNSAQERNAAAVEAIIVEKSMAPLTANAPSSNMSPAMTASAQAAAQNGGRVAPNGQTAPALQPQSGAAGGAMMLGDDWQSQQGGGAWKKRGCGCGAASAMSPQKKLSNGNRLVALKRMQQGIQAKQDFCDFDFCPVL